jgi:anti-repressor protein
MAGRLKQNGLDIGQNHLFEWLRENGYVYKKQSSYNLPTQKSLQLKLMEVYIHTRADSSGNLVTEKTTKVTARGQEYFFKRLMADRTFFDERIPAVREMRQKEKEQA